MKKIILGILGLLVSVFFENPKDQNVRTCGFQTTCVPPEDAANGSWQMFYGSQKHTGVQLMKGNLSSGRYVKWTYTTGGPVYSSPAIGDINGDRRIEVVVGSYDGNVYALRGIDVTFLRFFRSERLLWSFKTGDSVYSSPAIGDINGDGKSEIVVGSRDGKIYAIRGTDGNLLWTFTTGSPVYSSPALGDINVDGQVEVIVGSKDGKIYVLRGTDGNLLWSYPTGGPLYSSPALGDVNGDGESEVVVGSYDGNVYALRGIYGGILWFFTTGGPISSSPAIGDINGDGQIEVVVGSEDGKVYSLRGKSITLLEYIKTRTPVERLLWSFTTGGPVSSSPAIGDIDRDGQVEVIVGSGDGKIYVLRGTDGSLIWSYNIGSPYYWTEKIVLADIDPTPGIEIITYGSGTPTYVLSSSGTLLWSINPLMNQSSLSVGDIDGDGCVEIVVAGLSGLRSPMVAVIDASSNEGNCNTE